MLRSLSPCPSPVPGRLESLRALMRRMRLDAVIVPSSDPHLSEYPPARWQGLAWLSGFSGSAGTVVVTASFAGLWTDARYWEQAERELTGTGIALMKLEPGVHLQHAHWLASYLAPGQRVAVDAQVLDIAGARKLFDILAASDIRLLTDGDMLGDVWGRRPNLPEEKIYEHPLAYAGLTRAGKLANTREAMQRIGTNTHFISTLDDIAYLFNLRGGDVRFNPVFLAYALIGVDYAILFVGGGKIDEALRAALHVDNIRIEAYELAADALSKLGSSATLLLDPMRITAGMRAAVPSAVRVIEATNPTTLAKARKTDSEVAHIRVTMEHDGAALCEFFAWLDGTLANPAHEPMTELDIERRLADCRRGQLGFITPSFGTIAGFNANGALIHYRATEKSRAVIEGHGLLLIDSGGQYLGGTTDITRMVAVGNITDMQRRDCTLVLKGLIALSSAQYPRSTRSPMLDAIARAPLWAAAANYGHGTGHGVGYFLNVHEGPQSISAHAMPSPDTAMEVGMVTSIEPGLYRAGQWGVRIENLVVNIEGAASEFGSFLRFETLTLCPIDTRCLDIRMLDTDERQWLDDYHALVRSRLVPYLAGSARTWLMERTVPLATV